MLTYRKYSLRKLFDYVPFAACEEADYVLLVGTNPRYEAPLLNTRLRKGYVHNEQNVALVGPKVDLSYGYEVRTRNRESIHVNYNISPLFQNLGEDSSVIAEIACGRHPFAQKLKCAKKPLIIIGADQLARKDGQAFLAALQTFANTLKPEDV